MNETDSQGLWFRCVPEAMAILFEACRHAGYPQFSAPIGPLPT